MKFAVWAGSAHLKRLSTTCCSKHGITGANEGTSEGTSEGTNEGTNKGTNKRAVDNGGDEG